MTAVEWLADEIIMLEEKLRLEEININDFMDAKDELVSKALEMEKERTLKLCYGVWRAAKSGANYIYISKDSDLLGYVEPLSEDDRLKIDVELFIAIKPI